MTIAISVLPYVIWALALGVVGVLFVGLFSMAKGGEFNRRYANVLMRWRVGLQAATVTLFVIYLFLIRMS
jgi:hypothetical protein